jgi:hypothetical protein
MSRRSFITALVGLPVLAAAATVPDTANPKKLRILMNLNSAIEAIA